MPKVILKSTMCGPRGSFQAGAEVDVDAQTAKELIDGGYAEAVRVDAPVLEAATAPAPEHHDNPAPIRRKGGK